MLEPSIFSKEPSHFSIQGPAGLLEVMTTYSESPLGVAIVCHPHPLHEGTMHNKVVHTLARAFERKGFSTVRFNYRGVGKSEGSYGQALGETDDLLAVIHWVNRVCAEPDLWLAGFSFGSYVAAKGATQTKRVKQLISVAPSVDNFPFKELPSIEVPWLVIQGGQDEIVDVASVQDWAKTQQNNAPSLFDFYLVEDAGHFFHGRLIELRTLLETHLILS